jgi:diaminopimelate decarboxylase
MTLLDFLPSLHQAATPRIDPAIWPLTARVDELGRLCVGDVPLTEIADEFRTPAYGLDEADFRHRLNRYRTMLRNVDTIYARKALRTTTVARWVAEEGSGVDVSSGGELATAVGVGRVVVDSLMEIAYLACEVRRPQRVLVRVTPGVDIHGHTAVMTGVNDQKFGFTLAGGHAIRRMIAAMADIRARHRVILHELNIGGGHGIPYVTGDPELDLAELADVIGDALNWACASERFPRPRIVVEPGRAVSARGDAVPGGVGEDPTGWTHVRRGGRRHVRQSARRALRCEIHCDTGQPSFARADERRHRRRTAL